MRCPHQQIAYCPLYVAAHEAGGFGCDDGKLDHGSCAVDRGMDYGKAVARLWQAKPDLVKECAEGESAAMACEQRQRNMRAAGLH
jgi:hypothetical protein